MKPDCYELDSRRDQAKFSGFDLNSLSIYHQHPAFINDCMIKVYQQFRQKARIPEISGAKP
jgi:hypothetical protein